MADKYILYTRNNKTEYDTFEEAKKAYEKCPELYKFLYQPDKVYFLGTISSTGKKVGHDHKLHRTVAKCYGLFMAENKNQIKRYLEKAAWYRQGADTYYSEPSKARLYGNGPYGSLYQNNDNQWTGWEHFEHDLQFWYLQESNISYPHRLDDTYGAIDVSKPVIRDNPYRLY